MKVVTNNIERSHAPITQFHLRVKPCRTIVHFHNQDFDIDIIKMHNTSITNTIPHVALYSHSHYPSPPTPP